MATNRVWVRGVKGRLTRIERKAPFLSVDHWQQVTMTRRIQQKADRGSLEVSFKDPNPKTKSAPKVEPVQKEANQ